jgi:hypothetical protein
MAGNTMTFVKRGLLLVLLLICAYLIFVFAMRQRDPTPEQQAALDVLRAPNPQWEGDDAYPALWALGYAVPADQQAAVLQEDVARIDAAAGEHGGPGNGRFERLPDLPANSPGLCRADESCLATVRAAREAAATLVQTHDARLQQSLAPALLDAGHARYPFRPTLASPIAAAPAFHLVRTHHALRYLDGDVAGALTGTCRQIASWRRLSAHTDSLVLSIVGARVVAENLELFGEILAELPPDLGLPAECGGAVAATDAAELDLCPSFRNEFRMYDAIASMDRSQLFSNDVGLPALPGQLLFDNEALVARSAPVIGGMCMEATRGAMVADQPLPPVPAPECSFAERLADPTGCELIGIAVPDYGGYAARRMDLRAQLLLARTLLWLRGQAADPRPLADRLAARPAELQMETRPVTLGEDGASLRVPLHYTRDGEYFSLPLPLALRAAAAPAVAPAATEAPAAPVPAPAQ